MFLLNDINLLNSVFDGLKRFLSMPWVLIALALSIIGLAFVILARRFARVVRKTDFIADNDKCLITFKIVGIVLMFVAIMMLIFIK